MGKQLEQDRCFLSSMKVGHCIPSWLLAGDKGVAVCQGQLPRGGKDLRVVELRLAQLAKAIRLLGLILHRGAHIAILLQANMDTRRHRLCAQRFHNLP